MVNALAVMHGRPPRTPCGKRAVLRGGGGDSEAAGPLAHRPLPHEHLPLVPGSNVDADELRGTVEERAILRTAHAEGVVLHPVNPRRYALHHICSGLELVELR